MKNLLIALLLLATLAATAAGCSRRNESGAGLPGAHDRNASSAQGASSP